MHPLFRVVVAASLALGVTAGAFAATPATGLGQSWPNAPDVSTNPHFHVYVFELGGVRYIQVNDTNGNVLGSVGTASGQFITLPVGRFASLVSTPSQPAAAQSASPAAAAQAVYNDGVTSVSVTPLSNGALKLEAATAQGTCDPIDCNIKNQ
ncbi:hypothetical protein [Dyella sp. C9]|uniref:hypothetical protein n=1 Tax=Dyella sp. C9 TaxID=2202154 RepID=UPI000DEF1098|nr:hypothetical protein [Dyella sp. C9]